MAKTNRKIASFDIETSPSRGWYFNLYQEGNILEVDKHWHIMSFAYKWLGEDKVYVVSMRDFKLYKKDKENDKEVVKKLWELANEAEVLIAHNGNSFDIKKMNARFLAHGLTPPTPYKSIDTKLVAKRYFKFDSNKLDDLGDYLGIGRKLQTGGKGLWFKCMEGDKKAWDLMCEYNKQDVILLEKVYLKMLPYMTTHPNYNLLMGTTHSCPNCGEDKLQKRGFATTRVSMNQRFQCTGCGSWSQGEKIAR